MLTDKEIIALPRIADVLLEANGHLLHDRIDEAKSGAILALDMVHRVWGATPKGSAVAMVQVWAIQALWVGINNAEFKEAVL